MRRTLKFGFEKVTEVVNFEVKNVRAVKELMERRGDYGGLRLCVYEAVDAYLDEGQAERVEREFSIVKDEMEKRKFSEVQGSRCCFSFTAASFWPYKIVLNLLMIIPQRGVNFQTQTSSLDIDYMAYSQDA